jgi:hypothetical protein
MSNEKLTYEYCKEIASKYETRNELKKGNESVYSKCRKNNWLVEFTPSRRQEYDYKHWTYENCKEVVNKCNNKKEFSIEYAGAYRSSIRNNWLDEFFPDIRKNITYDECIELSKKYEFFTHFKKNEHVHYRKCVNENWLDDIIECIRLHKIANLREKCSSIAKEYTNIVDLKRNHNNIYQLIKKNEWYDELCSHFDVITHINKRRTIYAYEFDNTYVYIGLTDNLDRRHTTRFKDDKDAVSIFVKNNPNSKYKLIIKEKEVDQDKAGEREGFWLNYYIENNWNSINRAKTGSLGATTVYDIGLSKITKEDCIEKVKECITISNFIKNAKEHYLVAIHNNWLSEFVFNNYSFWNYEKCKSAASYCKTRNEFQINNYGAYACALRNGWIEDICSHMEYKTKWTFDECYSRTIQYNKLHKFKSSNKRMFDYIAIHYDENILYSHIEEPILRNQWNFDKCKEDALLYRTKTEYKNNSNTSYRNAIKNGWLNDICSHMKSYNIKWDYNSCKELFLICSSKKEILEKSESAYKSAKRNGWFEELVKLIS